MRFFIGDIAKSLRLDPRTKCGDIKKRADIKIAEIGEKIHTLQRMD